MDVNESEDNLPTSQQKSTSHTAPVLKPSAREGEMTEIRQTGVKPITFNNNNITRCNTVNTEKK